jgi:CRISPR-associated protein Cmr1
MGKGAMIMAERKLPKDMQTPPSINSSFQEKMIVETREYELITPLFGGGVEPNTPDPVTTIRATEIRGHLRFWWRATRGGQFKTIEELKAKEDEIWGAAAKFDKQGIPFGASDVSIEVSKASQGKPDTPFMVEGSKQKPTLVARPETRIPSYVAFPLQPPKAEQEPGMEIKPVYTNINFIVKIQYPKKYKLEVDAAVWAWETFGGLGARTRRGFGALNFTKLNNKIVDKSYTRDKDSFNSWIKEHLEKFIEKEDWPQNIPHLSKKIKISTLYNLENDAYSAWRKLIYKLSYFRQYRIDKETLKNNKYGHSDWPEPNAIRKAFGRSSKGPHANRNIHKFPRAQFGLPIIFHMPHDANLSTTLAGEMKIGGETKSRLASSLILKPIVVSNGAIGIGVLLEGTSLPLPLKLKNQSPPTEFQADPTLEPNEAQQITLLKGEKDVLKAFLAYLERK